jgi:hypothetical protein
MRTKFCKDCLEHRPVSEFSRNARSRDGLAFYCRKHLAERSARSREARRTKPRVYRRPPEGLVIPEGHKWCADCDGVLPLSVFVRTIRTASGYHAYCKPCHNKRGKVSRDKFGGSRDYHLSKRYGISADEADLMLEAQGGLCAICRTEPAQHVDHDHATGAVRALLCFNCNGGLGQFKDDPEVLRAAADYVERHRALRRSVSSRPETGEEPGVPPGRRRPGVLRDRRCSHGFARWQAMQASS